MELTVEVLREAEFREGWRGYNPADVDEFIDRVSMGVQELRDRIHALTVRAERAESRLGGENDETVKRTLVLAQRAADLVVSEAKSVAERIVQDAHREAERTLSEATASATAQRMKLEQETAAAATRQRDDATAEHDRLLQAFREQEQLAQRQAQLATARTAELNAQVLALRDRYRSALTDQLLRLDHLVDPALSSSAPTEQSEFAVDSSPDIGPDSVSDGSTSSDGDFTNSVSVGGSPPQV